MSIVDPPLRGSPLVRGLSAGRALRRTVDAIKALITSIRLSEYRQVGGSRRFQADQRRRTRSATRISMLVIAAGVAFDAFALVGLDFDKTKFAIAMDLLVFVVTLLGLWLLGGPLRRHPELVAGVATTGLAISTVTTGTLVPDLAVQSIGYLVLVPALIALLLPWRTQTHFRWLLSYGVIGFIYLALANTARFTADERGDLVIVLGVALGASLAGHVMLQRAQIRNFAQLERIGRLRRKSDGDMIELERLHHALELTAQTDPLTGIGNRRRLSDDLRAVRAHITRSGFNYGIAELDLDHFKAINDRYGHAVGDDVLKRVANAIQHSLRAEDAIYRLGGEEFLVILHVPNIESLSAAAERLRAVVIDLDIENPVNLPSGRVSVSIGATFIGPLDLGQPDDEWIGRADGALYEAKRAGRNQVSIWER